MRRQLPSLSEDQLAEQLRQISPEPLSGATLHALFLHYGELRRWNAHTSLIGPGTLDEVLVRHYGESLAALPLLRPDDQSLVDLGTGAGFPGWVLAAARPHLQVTLVEPKTRKVAFLRSATRKSGLSCHCLDARVGPQLPQGFPGKIDIITCRALKLSAEVFKLIADRHPRARFLLWQGVDEPSLPAGLEIRQEVALPGSRHRRLLEVSFRWDKASEPRGQEEP